MQPGTPEERIVVLVRKSESESRLQAAEAAEAAEAASHPAAPTIEDAMRLCHWAMPAQNLELAETYTRQHGVPVSRCLVEQNLGTSHLRSYRPETGCASQIFFVRLSYKTRSSISDTATCANSLASI